MKADTLQRFILDEANVRGEIVHIQTTYQKIINQHPYPPMVKHLLGEAIVSCLLLTSSIKFEGSLNVQFQGDERLPLLLVQCDHNLNIRAFAKFKENIDIQEYAAAFLTGKMVLTLEQNNQTQVYQSLVPLTSTSMSDNLMSYFAQSEQLATKVWLAVDDDKASGMLLQLMPGDDTVEREQFWEYAVKLGETVTESELLNLDNQTLLHRLYHETKVRLFESRPTCFQCRCSREKMRQVLSVLKDDELKQMIAEQEKITVSCDFCNQQYFFDAIDCYDLKGLELPPSTNKH